MQVAELTILLVDSNCYVYVLGYTGFFLPRCCIIVALVGMVLLVSD